MPVELIVYGKLPLMNSGYCLLGSSNKCYPSCDMKCTSSSKFYLKDRLGLNFRVVPALSPILLEFLFWMKVLMKLMILLSMLEMIKLLEEKVLLKEILIRMFRII